MDETVTGSCRCGQVRIAVQGPPMMTMACHCTGCQRMTASAFSLSAMYHQDAVRIEGETVLGGLKGELHHHFCPNCMSWLFTRAEIMGPVVNLRATMLDRPMTAPPHIECWTDEKLPWAQTAATRSYPGFPPPEDFPVLLSEFAAAQ